LPALDLTHRFDIPSSITPMPFWDLSHSLHREVITHARSNRRLGRRLATYKLSAFLMQWVYSLYNIIICCTALLLFLLTFVIGFSGSLLPLVLRICYCIYFKANKYDDDTFCVSVCVYSKRKMAWAINAKVGRDMTDLAWFDPEKVRMSTGSGSGWRQAWGCMSIRLHISQLYSLWPDRHRGLK